jgi:hypothetical protein
MLDAGNIAFLDDKIYIPQFGERQENGWLTGTLGMVDTKQNTYYPLQAIRSDGVVLPWAHPSSVTVGPDGLLYVLNNGPGDEALYAMEPDGHVVEQIPLNNTSVTARDLHFGENRTIYIADQELGQVLKYERTGGDPIGAFTGMESILNNPRSVAVDPRGSIYTTETYDRIQKLNSDGKFNYLYELYCTPRYFSENPLSEMWLEASCSTGLVSINTRDNYTQLVQFVGGDIRPQSPRGLTYGADDLLYVMEGDRILAYKVVH